MLDHHSALLGSRSTRLDLGFLLTFHNFWLVFDKSFPFFTRLQGKKRRMTQRPASGKYQPATDYHKILIHFYFLHNILETYVLSKVTQLLLKWKSPATSVHNASYFLSSKQQNKKIIGVNRTVSKTQTCDRMGLLLLRQLLSSSHLIRWCCYQWLLICLSAWFIMPYLL